MTISSSSLGSAISIGTAEARPLSPHKPAITDIPRPVAAVEYSDLLGMHRLPSPNLPASSPTSPVSQGTMHHLRRRPKACENRRSIIDPASVRVSFVGSITDLSQPLGMPLEEGFQKLYRLYEQNTQSPAELPHQVQITDIPLDTIADSLETHIKEQNDALHDCADNIQNLNLTHNRSKQDLITLEFQYCLARQEANMRSLTSEDTRLRMEWMREEIIRVNTEKEKALQRSADCKKENDRLKKELVDMLDTRQENQKLKQIGVVYQEKQRGLQQQLEEVKRQLDRAHFALQTVPSRLQKICAKVLVPAKDKENVTLPI